MTAASHECLLKAQSTTCNAIETVASVSTTYSTFLYCLSNVRQKALASIIMSIHGQPGRRPHLEFPGAAHHERSLTFL